MHPAGRRSSAGWRHPAAFPPPVRGSRSGRPGPCRRHEHAGQRMHKHARHAQRVGHQAGMLTAGAAEALQRVARHVVAARHEIFLMALAICCTAMLMKPSATTRRCGRCGRPARETSGRHRLHASGSFVGIGARTPSEIARLDLAGHHVPASVTASGPPGGSWPGRGWRPPALRAHAEAGAIEFQDRPPPPQPRCGCSSSARARTPTTWVSDSRSNSPRNATRRWTCRPCQSRSPCRGPPGAAVQAMPTMPPAGPGSRPCLEGAGRRSGRRGLHEEQLTPGISPATCST